MNNDNEGIFDDDDELKDSVVTWLREKVGNFYNIGIKKFNSRLTKCIDIHGDYVEK